MYTILGRPPACRAGHTKGTFCAGVFTPYGEAAELTEAAHLQDAPVEATVRFSRVTGNPDNHDGQNGRCGMATRFHLPDGSDTDLIAISLDRFTNRRPQDFVEMNYACFKPGDSKVKRGFKTVRFLLHHPESFRPMMKPPSASSRSRATQTAGSTPSTRSCGRRATRGASCATAGSRTRASVPSRKRKRWSARRTTSSRTSRSASAHVRPAPSGSGSRFSSPRATMRRRALSTTRYECGRRVPIASCRQAGTPSARASSRRECWS